MSQEIRRRNTSANTERNPMSNSTTNTDDVYAAGLRIPNMLKASPQHSGDVYKLHIPFLFSVLPRFAQQWMIKMKFLSLLGLLPSWEPRFIILLGRFLYKFSNRQDSKAPPKGTPLAMDSADIYELDEDSIAMDDNAVALKDRPGGFPYVFIVSTLRKSHYYVAPSQEEARTWVNSMVQARHESIKRNMGHAPKDSYPSSWSYFDNMGNNLVKSRERIKQKVHQANLQELEMTNMGVGGPSGVGGYYG